ncbi:hypothetical protein ACJX0J_021239, partial [Zea mays]
MFILSLLGGVQVQTSLKTSFPKNKLFGFPFLLPILSYNTGDQFQHDHAKHCLHYFIMYDNIYFVFYLLGGVQVQGFDDEWDHGLRFGFPFLLENWQDSLIF